MYSSLCADIDNHHIDNHRYTAYRRLMNAKTRPGNCCAPVVIPMPLAIERQGELVAAFKALSDPSRFDIFRLVAAQEEAICVCDIVDRFELTQPTISHHLKVLREAGLIQVSRRGVWAYYAVDARGLALLRGAFGELAPVEAALR
jgi:ArsR family transcriptional regulator